MDNPLHKDTDLTWEEHKTVYLAQAASWFVIQNQWACEGSMIVGPYGSEMLAEGYLERVEPLSSRLVATDKYRLWHADFMYKNG